MRIETFLQVYKTKKTDDEKKQAIDSIMKNETIKYSDKVDRTGLIAQKSYHAMKSDADGVEREVFEQNSAAKYMLYSLTLVDLYTSLDIDYKKSLEQFELLNGEVLDFIINDIDERELKEFQMLLDFACDDIMVNEYEPHAFMREQVNRFSELFKVALSSVTQNIDTAQIEDVIKKTSEAISANGS